MWNMRVIAIAGVLLTGLGAMQAAAIKVGPTKEVFTFMPLLFDFEAGEVYDCARPDTLSPSGVARCAIEPPLVLEHDHGDHEGGFDHTTNAWSNTENLAGGKVRKSCGEWHADQAGWSGNACDMGLSSDGTNRVVSTVILYRCLSTDWCSDHASNGIIKTFLWNPSSFEFYNTLHNGVYSAGCSGTFGTGSSTPRFTAASIVDDSPFCATGLTTGYWGGGVEYTP